MKQRDILEKYMKIRCTPLKSIAILLLAAYSTMYSASSHAVIPDRTNPAYMCTTAPVAQQAVFKIEGDKITFTKKGLLEAQNQGNKKAKELNEVLSEMSNEYYKLHHDSKMEFTLSPVFQTNGDIDQSIWADLRDSFKVQYNKAVSAEEAAAATIAKNSPPALISFPARL